MIETENFYSNVKNFDASGWRWPDFSPQGLKCNCGKYCAGEYYHWPQFLDALEKLHAECGAIFVNSGRRCEKHNHEVGGASHSMHMVKIAADVRIIPHERKALYEGALKAGFTGMGFGVNFLHLDLGRKRRWDYPGGLVLWEKALGFNPLLKI